METGIKGSFFYSSGPLFLREFYNVIRICALPVLYLRYSPIPVSIRYYGHFLRSFTVLTTWLPCNSK